MDDIMETELIKTIKKTDPEFADYEFADEVLLIRIYKTGTYNRISIAVVLGKEMCSVHDCDPSRKGGNSKNDWLFNVALGNLESMGWEGVLDAMTTAHWLGRCMGREEGGDSVRKDRRIVLGLTNV